MRSSVEARLGRASHLGLLLVISTLCTFATEPNESIAWYEDILIRSDPASGLVVIVDDAEVFVLEPGPVIETRFAGSVAEVRGDTLDPGERVRLGDGIATVLAHTADGRVILDSPLVGEPGEHLLRIDRLVPVFSDPVAGSPRRFPLHPGGDGRIGFYVAADRFTLLALSRGGIAYTKRIDRSARQSQEPRRASSPESARETAVGLGAEPEGGEDLSGASTLPRDGGPGTAPDSASFITRLPEPALTNEVALADVGTGILKAQGGTGDLILAVDGVDYYAPGGTGVPESDLDAAVTRDAEWDSVGKINARTTDDDFVTVSGLQMIMGEKHLAADRVLEDGVRVRFDASKCALGAACEDEVDPSAYGEAAIHFTNNTPPGYDGRCDDVPADEPCPDPTISSGWNTTAGQGKINPELPSWAQFTELDWTTSMRDTAGRRHRYIEVNWEYTPPGDVGTERWRPFNFLVDMGPLGGPYDEPLSEFAIFGRKGKWSLLTNRSESLDRAGWLTLNAWRDGRNGESRGYSPLAVNDSVLSAPDPESGHYTTELRPRWSWSAGCEACEFGGFRVDGRVDGTMPYVNTVRGARVGMALEPASGVRHVDEMSGAIIEVGSDSPDPGDSIARVIGINVAPRWTAGSTLETYFHGVRVSSPQGTAPTTGTWNGIFVADQLGFGANGSAIHIEAQSGGGSRGNLTFAGGNWNTGHLVFNSFDHLYVDNSKNVLRFLPDVSAPASESAGHAVVTGSGSDAWGPALWAFPGTSCAQACDYAGLICREGYPMGVSAPIGCSDQNSTRICLCR